MMSNRLKDNKNIGCSVVLEQSADIYKTGYLKKLKTMKKKFFIIRKESENGPSRLEYYDSEKKWRSGALPKRTIVLKTCFNINRRVDVKHRYVIALYTRDDCFTIVAESEPELDEWLTALLELQHDGADLDGDCKPKPLFEHVWQVNVKTKGLGSSKNITGPHRLCLTAKSLSLVKMHSDQEQMTTLEFPLISIRRCGHSDCFFFMELGRSAITGAGELWMQTEDTVIAQNMHEAILIAMKSSRNKEDLGPMSRPRSASTSENSKPISTKRPVNPVPTSSQSLGRDRCDSMPTRSRNSSETQPDVSSVLTRGHTVESSRPHSTYTRTYSVSPPSGNTVGSCSMDSVGSSLSIEDCESQVDHFKYSHSLPVDILVGPKEPTITEEVSDDYLMMSSPVGNEDNKDNSMKLTSPDGSDYLKMSMSPTSSINDTVDSYIPVSPVGSLSLSSSVEKSVLDGYLPMEPTKSVLTSQAVSSVIVPGEYMDMAPLSSSLPKSGGESITDFSGSWCSAQSLHDVPNSSPLSGSLEGFHLDKVKSYFSPLEDDSEDYIKPVRAYSIGSRQQVKKSHLGAHLETSRVRAYSVGSQASGSARRHRQPDVDSELGTNRSFDSRTSVKSSSAPLLPGHVIPSPHAHSHRLDCNEDLMEINYDETKDVSSGHENEHSSGGSIRGSSCFPTVSISESLENGSSGRRLSSSGIQDKSDYMSMGSGAGTSAALSSHSSPGDSYAKCTGKEMNNGKGVKATTKFCSISTETKEGSTKQGSKNNNKENSSKPSYGTSHKPPHHVNTKEGTKALFPVKEVPVSSSGELNAGSEKIGSNTASFKDTYNDRCVAVQETSDTVLQDGPKIETKHHRNESKVDTNYEAIGVICKQEESTRQLTVNIPSKAIVSSEGPISPQSLMGEYVNLDLSKCNPTWKYTPSVKLSNMPSKSDLPHEYTNLHLGKSVNSNYTVMASVQTPTPNEPSGHNSPSVSRAHASHGVFKKQMSAPAPQCSEPLSHGRKSSCPVVEQQSVARVASNPGVPVPPSRCLLSKISPEPPDYNQTEATYENISFGCDSVSSSRPSSVSSEKELIYASLDLAPLSTSDDDKIPRSPRIQKLQSIPSAESNQPTFSYVEIDFTKSEGLRNTTGALREGRL